MSQREKADKLLEHPLLFTNMQRVLCIQINRLHSILTIRRPDGEFESRVLQSEARLVNIAAALDRTPVLYRLGRPDCMEPAWINWSNVDKASLHDNVLRLDMDRGPGSGAPGMARYWAHIVVLNKDTLSQYEFIGIVTEHHLLPFGDLAGPVTIQDRGGV